MSLVLAVYLLGFLSIKELFIGIVLGLPVIWVIARAISLDYELNKGKKDEVCERYANIHKKGIKWWVPFAVFTFLLPSEETGEKMLAVYVGTEIAQMEEVKEISSNTYKVINKLLTDFLDEPIQEPKQEAK